MSTVLDKQTTAKTLETLAGHLRPIMPFLDQDDVQEVMINCGDSIWIERAGKGMSKLDIAIPNDSVGAAIKSLASLNNKPTALILDSRLPGLRIAAARTPIALHGNAMSIRKHAKFKLTPQHYLESGAFDIADINDFHEATVEEYLSPKVRRDIAKGGQAVHDFLEWMITSAQNVSITGKTTSGKTTFMRSLADFLPRTTRLFTTEDTAELDLDLPNIVAFESLPSSGVTMESLVKLSLRFRPDRIWCGEARGPEVFDILDAYNTGHAGGLLTFHAESSSLALPRLETLLRKSDDAKNWPLEDMRRQIAAVFRFVIHCDRLSGKRGPREILEIVDVVNGVYVTRKLFSRDPRAQAEIYLPS